jgi:IclR family transcriptional regulator, KDG regulon repressor
MSSLGKGLAILDLYSSRTADLGVTEAARHLNIPKSSASRLMAAMAQQGLLEMERSTRRYRPGFLAFKLGSLYQSHTSLVDLADQGVGDLADRYAVTGYVSLRDGANIIVLRMRHGRTPLRTVVSEPGSCEPAFNTAAGRALLARLDETTLKALIPAQFATDDGQRMRAKEFVKHLAEVRTRGWAEASHYDGQIGAVAVTVVPDDSKIKPVALSLSFPQTSVDGTGRARMVTDLKRCAEELSQRFREPN